MRFDSRSRKLRRRRLMAETLERRNLMATLQGTIFLDANLNGTQQAGEAVLAAPASTVFLDINLDGNLNVGEPAATGGNYSFPGLLAGTYTLKVIPPSTFASIIVTQSISVGDEDVATIDFGVYRTAEIRGYKFHDLNADRLDNSEPRLSGINFRLVYAGPDNDFNTLADNVVSSLNPTDNSGLFEVNGLTRGQYRVVEDLPTGVTTTTNAIAIFNITTSGQLFQPSIGFGGADAFQTEIVRPALAIGNFRLGEIRGYKFVDRNANGIDNGETRLDGVRFELRSAGNDGNFGTADDTVTTSLSAIGTGEFAFVGLSLGRYRLQEEILAGVQVTTADFTDFEITTSGQLFVPNATFGSVDTFQTRIVRADIARGNFRLGEIHGYKFTDVNGNGIDDSDPKLQGVQFRLTWAGPDNDFTTTVPSDIQLSSPTGGDGRFQFTGLVRGLYRLEEILLPNFIRTTLALGVFNINDSGKLFVPITTPVVPDRFQVADTSKPQLAVGNFRLGTIAGYAFGDTNGDGIDTARAEPRGDAVLTVPPEASELRVVVRLRRVGTTAILATTTSDANGLYSFNDLRAGSYELLVDSISPTSRKFTTPTLITPLEIISGSVYEPFTGLVTQLDAAQTSTTQVSLAIGSAKKAVIKGIVFLDKDGNGTRAAGELGMANFKVELVGAGADDSFGTSDDLTFPAITTSASGTYEFTVDARTVSAPDTLPGRFQIKLTEPLHYLRGSIGVAGTETRTITNVRLNGILLGDNSLSPTAAEKNADQTRSLTTSLNFATQRFAAIYGVAFNDLNASGAKDAGEPIIANQKFRITGALPTFVPREATSNAQGVFSFDDLPADTYSIAQVLETTTANGVVQETQGRTTLTFTQPVVLNNEYTAPDVPDPRLPFEALNRIGLTVLPTLNFGRVQLSKLEGFVYNDANGNGIRESSEGQSGVVVGLRRVVQQYKQDELLENRNLNSDNTGKYTFYAWPGVYEVAEVVPTGFEPSSPRLRFTDYGLINIDNATVKSLWTTVSNLDGENSPQNDVIVANEYVSRPGMLGGISIYHNVGTTNYRSETIDLGLNSRPSFALAVNLDSDAEKEIIITTSGIPVLATPYSQAFGDVIIFDKVNGRYVPKDPTTGLLTTELGNRMRPVNTSIAGDGPRHVSVGDVNNDGFVDLVITNERNYDPKTNTNVQHFEDVSIALGGPKPLTFAKSTSTIINVSTTNQTAQVLTTAIGDFNGDGKANEIAVAEGKFGKIEFFTVVNGKVVPVPGLPAITGAGQPTHVIAANVAGDSKVDLIVSDYLGARILVYPQANGKLSAPIVTATKGKPNYMDVTDLDKDGDLDIGVATLNDGSAQFLFNSGTGSFLPSRPLSVLAKSLPGENAPIVSIQQIAFGDLNADGVQDLVATHFTGGVSVHPSAVTTAAQWKNLTPSTGPTLGIELPDNRKPTEVPLGENLLVMPLATRLPSPNVQYPLASQLFNKGNHNVPESFAVSPTIGTYVAPDLGNVRTAPLPLSSSLATKASASKFDVNGNGQVEPLDALILIDALAHARSSGVNQHDVNGDGVLTPLDVLLLIENIVSTRTGRGVTNTSVSLAQAQTLFSAAIERLKDLGVDQTRLAPLSSVSLSIQNLPTGTLSWVVGNSLEIDPDADGQGWFIDSTPTIDEEFVGGKSVAGVDLLSVVTHEIGHLLGLDDLEEENESDIMSPKLAAGIRRLSPAAVDKLFAEV